VRAKTTSVAATVLERLVNDKGCGASKAKSDRVAMRVNIGCRVDGWKKAGGIWKLLARGRKLLNRR
jgi:hypothetical protein